MGSSTPITQWVINQGFPYNTNINSDPNGHGVNLLMAYALNLDPKQSLGGSMPKPVIAGNQMSLTFYAGTTGVTYAVQTSTDLKNWTTTGVALSALDANNRCTATVTRTGNTNRFMRLVVVN